MTIYTQRTADAHRARIVELAYASIVAAAFKLRKRYRTSFEDIDLTIDDLGQFGALKAIERYDRLYDQDPDGTLAMADEDLKKTIVSLAMRCIACHIIDTYRMRDRRRGTVAPDQLITEMDNSAVDRIELWRRIEPVMRRIAPRQRDIVRSLWDGLEPDEVGETLKISANVVQKDLAAIRRLAA